LLPLLAALSALVLLLLLLARRSIFAPPRLFERLREAVAENILEPGKLPDLDRWNDLSGLLTIDDLYQQSQDLLASLEDFYTCLISPSPVSFAGMARSLNDYGLSFGLKKTVGGLLVLDADGNLLPEQDELERPRVMVVIQDSAAFKSGFRPGDIVVSVAGKAAAGLSLGRLNSLSEHEDTDFVLLRDGSEMQARLSVKSPRVPPLRLSHLEGGVSCLRVESFEKVSNASLRAAVERLAGNRAMIVDLRGNRGGDLRSSLILLSAFLGQGTLACFERRGRAGELEKMRFQLGPTQIVIEKREEGSEFVPVGQSEPLRRLPERGRGKPLIVLVDGCSMSGAELFAGALKDLGRAKIVGERTFGKGVGQDVIGIPPCVKVSVTALRFTTPSGIWPGDGAISISNGIEPDELIATGDGVVIGGTSDFQLWHAVKMLRDQL
jgi:C-terminal processing protease CtpA/Prc